MAILLILLAVAIAIVFKNHLPSYLSIWSIVLLGALLTLALRLVTPVQAFHSIDYSMMFYLSGIFILAAILDSAGILDELFVGLLRYFNNLSLFFFSLVMIIGVLSAILMNDTVALIFVPFLVRLAKRINTSPSLLLLLLAYAVTIGSVASPIGNPQNLLVASHMPYAHPFMLFAKYLGIPTLVNLLLIYVFFAARLRHLSIKTLIHEQNQSIADHFPAKLAYLSLFMLCACIATHVVLSFYAIAFPLVWVAWIPLLPLLFQPAHWRLCRNIDWRTLLFFIGLFIMVAALWANPTIAFYLRHDLASYHQPIIIMLCSALLSQIISNVPAVALYLPLLNHASVISWMYLVVGSTLAGSFWIMGAASNIIIMQQAKSLGSKVFSNWEFVRYGLLLAITQMVVYVFYLYVV